jgi:Mrp family chromosome partitioning ATPase
MPGTVITFYSYKGGVGRSFAVANIAVILAQWGARVLAVDWDLEAPGLNHFFAEAAPSHPAGVLDFIEDCRKGEPRSWDAYATPLTLQDGTQGLKLMPAMASSGADYTDRVQHLDWDELYDEHKFGARLEAMRAQWVEEFDFVLVDSRTGVTDFSGLTTVQLPDVLAFMRKASKAARTSPVGLWTRAASCRSTDLLCCHLPSPRASSSGRNMSVPSSGARVLPGTLRRSSIAGAPSAPTP